MNYRETADECPSCGATARDRAQNKPNSAQGLETCPYCNDLYNEHLAETRATIRRAQS